MALIFPVDSDRITSKYGARNTGIAGASTFHEGVDIGVASGTPVYAANGGTVTASGYNSTSGNYIKITGSDGLTTFYGHLSASNVTTGQTVNAGDQIAYSGNTGVSSGAHLHFGVYQNGKSIDPLTLQYGTADGLNAAQTSENGASGLLLIIGGALLILAFLR